MKAVEMDCNPPPPQEVLEDYDALVPDKIGETVFSKQWLFQSLLSILQAVENEKDVIQKQEASDNSNNGSKIELDPEIEERVCTLWDMSSDSDVAHFLLENNAVELFLEIINVTVSPRLVETVIGILGNMAFFDDICQHISKNNKLVEQILQLIGSSDAPILIQIVRLIHVCIVNVNSSLLWIGTITNKFIESLTFILENSLNGELLKRTLQLTYCILDKAERTSLDCNLSNVIKAVNESGKQLLQLDDYKSLGEYWHTLYYLLQQEACIDIDESFNSVYYIFNQYISKQKDNENRLPCPDGITALAASISVFLNLTAFDKLNYQFVITDHAFLSCMEDINGAVAKMIAKRENCKKNTDINEEVTSNPTPNDQNIECDENDLVDLNHLYILRDSLREFFEFVRNS